MSDIPKYILTQCPVHSSITLALDLSKGILSPCVLCEDASNKTNSIAKAIEENDKCSCSCSNFLLKSKCGLCKAIKSVFAK